MQFLRSSKEQNWHDRKLHEDIEKNLENAVEIIREIKLIEK